MAQDNGNRPVSKAEFDRGLMELRSELKTDFKQEMTELKDDLIEQMRGIETKIRTAFHNWPRPVEIRIRTVEQISERMAFLQERVAELERRNHPFA